MTDNSVQPDSISGDIDALRENFRLSGASFGWMQLLLLTLVGLGVLGGGFWYSQSHSEASSLEPLVLLTTPLDVSKMPAEDRWLSAATSQALNAYLDAGAQIQIREASQDRSAEETHADWVVSGAISTSEDGSSIVLFLELTSAHDTGLHFSTEVSGLRTDLADLSERAAAEVLLWLERTPLSDEQAGAASAELLTESGANKAYSEGRLALDRHEARTAITLFEEALQLEGPHPVIYAALSEAWSRLGYETLALEAINDAFGNRLGLTRERQLEIEAQYRIVNSEWPRAIEVLTALKEFHPNDLIYRLDLIEVHLLASNMEAAEAAIQEARLMSPPIGEDARIDLAEAQFWYQKGDYLKGSEASQRAEDKARRLGHTALLADALYSYGGDKVIARLEEARALYEKLDDPDNLAGVISALSYSKRISGQLQDAEAAALQAIELAQSTQNAARVADVQLSLSVIYDLQGRLSEGYRLKQTVADYYLERDILGRYSIMLENLGISLFKMGQLTQAEEMFGDARKMFIEIDDQIGVAWQPYHQSRIYSRQGDLSAAMRLANEAAENAAQRPEGDLKGNSEFEIAHILFLQGDYARADAMFAALEQSYAAYDNTISVSESQLMRARIAYRIHEHKAARRLMESAVELIGNDVLPSYLLQVHIVSADLQFASSDPIILSFCEELGEVIEKLEDQETALRARTRLSRCLAEARSVELKQALNDLTNVEAEARALGLFEPLLDCNIQRYHLYQHFGQVQNARVAQQAALLLAEENGWDISWAWG